MAVAHGGNIVLFETAVGLGFTSCWLWVNLDGGQEAVVGIQDDQKRYVFYVHSSFADPE